jgi:hypothetical protein
MIDATEGDIPLLGVEECLDLQPSSRLPSIFMLRLRLPVLTMAGTAAVLSDSTVDIS